MCQVKFKMALGSSSLNNYLSCQICSENFEEHGYYIPRILPCHHTVCGSCIREMIRGNKIICPECRKEHEAKNQEKSFQQNKYILVQMSRKKKLRREIVLKLTPVQTTKRNSSSSVKKSVARSPSVKPA